MRLGEAKDKLVEFLRDERLAERGDHFLLAVSGGVDSMVMLEVFAEAGLKSTVAHMNFSLRGEESDEDAQFVRNRCLELAIPCHIQKVDCKSYAADKGLNIQAAARELRYTWFEALITETSSNYICTAHHKDDAVETLFINLIRGTGVRGLTGIPLKRGRIIRPMMCFDRDEINAIADVNEVLYREDSSNASTKYLRNKIRHQLVPLIDQIHLGSKNVLFDDIQRFRDHMDAFRAMEATLMQPVITQTDHGVSVDLKGLQQIPAYSYLFARLCGHFGFSSVQASNLLSSERPSGTRFQSHSHEMTRDRDQINIRRRTNRPSSTQHRIDLSEIDQDHITHGGQLEIMEIAPPPDYSDDSHVEFIDADKLGNELILRKWRHGDKFVPLGMSGSQKVSDILTNRKLSVFEKENVYVLESDGEIVWLAGIKPSERFKVTDHTKRIFKLTWQKH